MNERGTLRGASLRFGNKKQKNRPIYDCVFVLGGGYNIECAIGTQKQSDISREEIHAKFLIKEETEAGREER